jgi:hypothetical protein
MFLTLQKKKKQNVNREFNSTNGRGEKSSLFILATNSQSLHEISNYQVALLIYTTD